MGLQGSSTYFWIYRGVITIEEKPKSPAQMPQVSARELTYAVEGKLATT